MRLLTPLTIKSIRGIKLKDKPFELLNHLIYRTDILGCVGEIVVPKGFRTDFLSIPRFFRRAFSPIGKYRESGVVHDFLCNPVDENLDPIQYICNHVEAGDVFYEALIDLGTRKWKSRLFRWSVVKFGPKFDKDDQSTLGWKPIVDDI